MGAASRTGARILVDQLRVHGVDTAFCVPGESYLAVLDALHDANSIRLVTCRQEGGATMMADADAKLTGKPGIVMVSRGPGAMNGSAGLHIARQDATPLIMFIGQVARGTIEREALQAIDYRQMFGPVAKWVAQIDDPAAIPEFVSQAFHVATNGRPGPVVLALPEDMLTDSADIPDAAPYRIASTYPSPDALAEFRRALEQAERPFFIVGGSTWTPETAARMQEFAAANKLPVGCAFRRQSLFDNAHDSYAGDVGIGINPKLAQRIRESDLIVAIGARLGEVTTGGYTLFDIPAPKQKLIHVYPDPEELGRVYRPSLAIAAASRDFADALSSVPPVASPRWAARTAEMRADYLAWRAPVKSPGAVQMSEIVAWLDANVPADTIFANGAGNFATWVHRFHAYRGFATQLAPTSGSMGYGLPAAVAASLRHPGRQVLCFTGDGDFLMTGQEFATAVANRAKLVAILLNNNSYGTIRMHQEMHYPGRVSGTDLANPDFAALARAYGGHGETVERTEQFADAFRRARDSGKPALIEIRFDLEAITPSRSLSDLRRS
ncbi:MAG TPA: thiamine pyrophosphate-binding protein [Stellaceae bacterium]|nr:thiamine pyrophosphate-binding protein [Stellaceae bacterium]